MTLVETEAMDAAVTVAVEGAALVVTLNRPRVRNAIDRAMTEAISAAMDRLDADPGLRVGILGAAGPVFCAGMDLKAFARGEVSRIGERGFAGIAGKPPAKPLIAAVEGPALGGGFEVVLACDLVVASENASFGLPEVTRGLTAGAGGLFRLPGRIPANVAMELVLTGDSISAATAFELHLVNRLVAPGTALAEALVLAARIAANGPLATLASKQVIQLSPDWPVDERFARQEPIIAPVMASRDAKEGATAFAEKRAPRWSGA
jgi:enoyl-CoA hydratase